MLRAGARWQYPNFMPLIGFFNQLYLMATPAMADKIAAELGSK
jgi:hypothetical protein